MVLFFHDEVNLTLLRASSYDRPFRDARHADLFVAWQSTLREHWHSRRFNSCAVVGSSGSLLIGQPRGALIDQHDAVFRVNYAPTRGYEEYVGRKTTVWVLAWGANTSVNERHLRPKSSLGKTSALLNQTQHPARGDPHLRPPSPPQPLPALVTLSPPRRPVIILFSVRQEREILMLLLIIVEQWRRRAQGRRIAQTLIIPCCRDAALPAPAPLHCGRLLI